MSSDSDDWDWDNGNDETSFRTPCLFCKEFLDIDLLLKHMNEKHHISFEELYQIAQGNQYNYIKLINFIRKNKINVEEVKNFNANFFEEIENNKYLLPTINGDGLLMIDAKWNDDDITLANTIDKMDELDDSTQQELLEIKKEDESAMSVEKKSKHSEESDD
ncbi:hypothetical protein EHI8A_010360 [Entamoeba histolytica HM-1:IMSS-B]|uniref:type I protein arginine methyltransferase n=6 Tax=Entamoeba histolytica TaxID=5759 RepID=C4LTZ9_ENTH1|nr:hypothetical protein EHI_068030 [Entamoeba histolytica HM-1:IMSS]EMD46895.1 Hypothetical protein EHI5A_003820 [Entamoeba histolytica KU27]EMH77371.1 hypothetical protein EHI8A_010360 [Entamoeba histolytica HM-1:IMSS-B]EMS14259.1 hypothetical protein KM1_016690 [Entamoeba histolytica HM-3:IMSS]ENY65835.1 hypothetical protein EHI7A_013230 [Entamoeba histolytica HM-1:IMSS-A]GAT92062.1 hypothetical protein CL6EHI_068030 [Entamoeba histolytica]|eukprot:XP_656766.1 hypothetical protein EHI_068030 [Entamoeba histolytica HM-1:IMSS]